MFPAMTPFQHVTRRLLRRSRHRIGSLTITPTLPHRPLSIRTSPCPSYEEYWPLWAQQKPRPLLPTPEAERFEPLPLQPFIYNSHASSWGVAQQTTRSLSRGSILKIISWNLEAFKPDARARANAAMTYLRGILGDAPTQHVVMLQELRLQSLETVLEHPWVRDNFTLTNIEPPRSLDIEGDGFIMLGAKWRAPHYFTLVMVSRSLPISSCFRLPFRSSNMGRDTLVVDIATGPSKAKQAVRLCTTHLESLGPHRSHRFLQLMDVSRLLKGAHGQGSTIVGGIVGGDMNALDKPEHQFHKAAEIDLRDAWEDVPLPIPLLKPFQRDMTDGLARGNTWGYQSPSGRRDGKRLDKFLYTGSLETFALDEVPETSRRVGRLGAELKTEVEGWSRTRHEIRVIKGKLVEKEVTDFVSEERASKMRALTSQSGDEVSQLILTKRDDWVSDHFGITVGIRIL